MTNKERDYMRNVAISANCYYIEKYYEKLGQPKSDDEILAAAKYTYRKYGFGQCEETAYFERDKTNRRMYNTDVKRWYKTLNFIFKRDNYTCVYCGQVGGKLEADHIMPFSRGGSDEVGNLITSCRKCNRQKKDKTVEEFQQWRITKGLV